MTIVYPAENDTISAAAIDSNYIFGRIFPPNASLTINGKKSRIYKNGAFLDFLPLQHGRFIYNCNAVFGGDTLQIDRTVYYYPPPAPISSDTLFIDSTFLRPSTDIALLPGDALDFEFRGTPGCSAWCSIDGIATTIPMHPAGPMSGMYWGEAVFGQGGTRPTAMDSNLYRGSYVLESDDVCSNSRVQFYLVDQQGDTLSRSAEGKVSIWQSGVCQFAETALDITVLRTGAHKSYYYFLPQGIEVLLNGKVGESYRVQLTKNIHAWIEDNKIRMLPHGSSVPRRYVRLVRTEDREKSARVRVYTGAKLPFRIQQSSSPQSLVIYFYGITADTDWIRYDFKNKMIREIRWRQESDDVYMLTIELNQKHQWGYDASFDEHNNFVLDIKKAPRVGKRRKSALYNMKILLDPGHDPDAGFIGPTGFEEREANVLLSAIVADKLRKLGAEAIFTRQRGDGPALGERMRFAMQSDADILLSLHHNAVPAGVNPFKSRGTSTYYYHPQSLEPAKHIHGELLRELGLNDFGIYWDNLAMCRPTQMPAVLVEPAFMLHPEEERLVRSNDYRERCAKAIVRGLQNFMLEFGE